MTFKVLVVCAGNICRSPSAEAAINEAALARGIDVQVDSAGTGSWNLGEPPHSQAIAAGERAGLKIQGRARKVNSLDFDRHDVILAMDRSNLRDLMAMAPTLEAHAKMRLFRTYDTTSAEEEIPDPYGGPDEGYDETIRLVRLAAEGFVESLVSTGVEDAVALD
ncbi:MAG: low molecular weight protein-tyrosine-phosphatase [Acidimicrobiia bacterium]|jgi:protein-tyrosine phosphatase